MRYLIFSQEEKPSYPVCLLVPQIRKEEIQRAYLDTSDLNPNDLLVMDLHYVEGKKKTPMAEMKRYISEELISVFTELSVEYILVADSEYFKAFTKATKVDANVGYVMDSDYGPKVIYIPNYKAIFYDPEKIKAKIAQAMQALSNHRAGSYEAPGTGIIEFAAYPESYEDIKAWLNKLLAMDKPLTCDIEAFDLKHTKSGIGTITFCWSKTEGIAFTVDYAPIKGATEAPYGWYLYNKPVRALLKEFFRVYTEKMTYHSISFDVYILIAQLFMKDSLDTEGLLEGLEVMLRNWDDTKLITYLATNSCAGNKLGLKDQSQSYSGNYAMMDIDDITKIPLPKLLEYNLVDGLSTWFVKEKHLPTMIADQQQDIYDTIFKPATVDIIQMQLTGLPLNMERVKEVKAILQIDEDNALKAIRASNALQRYTYRLNEQWVAKRNAKLKVKRVTLADANAIFNPNSAPQLQDLLYNFLQLPILNLTKNKEPSTDGDTIRALKYHTQDPDILSFLAGMEDYKAVNKILSSFIPAFEAAHQASDGWYYLHGNFNLGGTLSGRLSSSEPNLQNLPATKSRYAKLIKSCFQAPPGWLFCGLDFDSLEDKISALTTKDPNKIKVYTDGYDGHSLRAYAYFGDRMTGIEDTVVSINSIQKVYPEERQESKIPTFALTYMGTYITLMKNCGFDQVKAKLIESRYHDLYVVSDQWVAAKLDIASQVGYVTAAFGLRVRTPLLKQVIRGNNKTPYEAEAEGRSAGNALGQSWCLLNSRAGSEFMTKVRKSQFRLDIKPCAQIHDAQYFLIRDNIEAIMFTNEHLVKAVQWQEHPDIQHDLVKLSGQLGIFFPDWSKEITIPVGASERDIFATIDKHMH